MSQFTFKVRKLAIVFYIDDLKNLNEIIRLDELDMPHLMTIRRNIPINEYNPSNTLTAL